MLAQSYQACRRSSDWSQNSCVHHNSSLHVPDIKSTSAMQILHQLLWFFYIISLEVLLDQGFVVYLPVRDYSRVAKSLIRSQDVDLLEERLIIKPLSSNCHLNLGGHKT